MNKLNKKFRFPFKGLGLPVLLGFVMVLSSCNESPFPNDVPPCEQSVELENFELVWSDEFEGTELDTSKWSYRIGDGCDDVPLACGAFDSVATDRCQWGNNEKQYYTDRPKNVRVEDGKLFITAVREPQPFRGYRYTSARIRTLNKGDWKYCRIDARAKMPIGQGYWPAIWMLSSERRYGGWPCSGEIDIMEYLGNNPFEILSTIHFGTSYWKFISNYFREPGFNFAEDFHTFTLVWDESCMRFFVDNQQVGDPFSPSSTLPQTYPFQEKFHLIMNVAVGGNLPGDPTPATVFPQSMEVDYVRVYKRTQP